jgi:hypothetical protein
MIKIASPTLMSPRPVELRTAPASNPIADAIKRV